MNHTETASSLRELTPSGQHARLILDGTNIILLHGRRNPELRYVLALREYLLSAKRDFVCFFDANTSYLLEAHSPQQSVCYQELLNMTASDSRFIVAPSGTEADELILAEAKRCSGLVLSNDKFRDRAKNNVWIWKRRHNVLAGSLELSVPSLGMRIPVLESAKAYF